MKRLLLIGAAVVAACSVTPGAHASSLLSTDLVNTGLTTSDADAATSAAATSASTLNPLLNKIPLLEGPDRRHICVISDQVDKSWCLYVAIP